MSWMYMPMVSGSCDASFSKGGRTALKLMTLTLRSIHVEENLMINCDKCKKAVSEGDGRKHNARTLCEDCYMDELVPRMQKAHYDNDAEFMQRLKFSYPVHPQKFH